MQAIILAAGMGRRLGRYTQDNTKCMLPVNGVRLIDRVLTPSDDPDHDLNEIKHYFASFPDAAKFPQNFAIE